MNYVRTFVIICFCLFLFPPTQAQLFQQINYPDNFFRNPLGIPIQLSGNFGELRNNHFHMGLDIRTAQRENLPVYAAAAGYVSRIKIEQYGYGRAVYITHPNGFTTLYAHLNDFFPALHEHVKNLQYSSQQWEQDLVFQPSIFPVTKGQLIAYSGNTGGSGGPHLHFEVRETYTENNLNPFKFNFGIVDKIPPFIYKLFMYDRRYSTYQMAPKVIAIKGANGTYTSSTSIVSINTPRLSFGISAEDKTNSSFSFGIYQAELYLDNQLQSAFRMDNFSYPDSRYINASIDFSTRAKGGTYIQHLSRLPGNNSPIFSKAAGDGLITINDNEVHDVLIKVSDAAGNTSNLRFKIKLNPTAVQNSMSITNWVPMPPGQPNEWKLDNIEAFFTSRAFYDTVPFFHQAREASNALVVSQIHHVHNFTVPVHDSFTVRIRAENPVPAELKEKVLMELISNKKKVAVKGIWNNGWMESKFRDLGMFQLRIDTVPPTLVPFGWANGANLAGKTSITMLAKDESSDLKNFKAELDGSWLMFSRKSDYFIHKFDERTKPGNHLLKVVVTDEAGNTTERNFKFSR